MTKLYIDYSQTVIYKICCNNPDITKVYVGLTTNFLNRKHKHKSHCNNENDERYNLKVYKFIRENGGWESWAMLIIEKYPCNNGIEAHSRERFYYEKLNSKLNTLYPGRTSKEYNKDYFKEYYEKNIIKINESKKEYRQEVKFLCECGKDISRNYKSDHIKTNNTYL